MGIGSPLLLRASVRASRRDTSHRRRSRSHRHTVNARANCAARQARRYTPSPDALPHRCVAPLRTAMNTCVSIMAALAAHPSPASSPRPARRSAAAPPPSVLSNGWALTVSIPVIVPVYGGAALVYTPHAPQGAGLTIADMRRHICAADDTSMIKAERPVLERAHCIVMRDQVIDIARYILRVLHMQCATLSQCMPRIAFAIRLHTTPISPIMKPVSSS